MKVLIPPTPIVIRAGRAQPVGRILLASSILVIFFACILFGWYGVLNLHEEMGLEHRDVDVGECARMMGLPVWRAFGKVDFKFGIGGPVDRATFFEKNPQRPSPS